MNQEWYVGADRKEVDRDVKKSPCLDHILRVLSAKIKAASEVSRSDYDTAAWAYKQAHLNGRYDAFRELERLINSAKEADPK